MANSNRDYGRQERYDRQDYGSPGEARDYLGHRYEEPRGRGWGEPGRGGSDVDRPDREFGGGYGNYGSYGSYGRSYGAGDYETGQRRFYGDRSRRDREAYDRPDFERGEAGRGYGGFGGGYGSTYGYSAFGGGTSGLTGGGYGGGYGGDYYGASGGAYGVDYDRYDRGASGGEYGAEFGGSRAGGQYGRTGYGYGDMYAAGSLGRHVGRGPRGYQRADARIEEDVNEALTRDPDVDASDIEVKVQAGEVTLMGEAGSREEKRRAEDLAEQCSGVRDVHNQIKVKKGLLDRLFGSRDDDREQGPERERGAERGGERASERGGERAATSR